MADPVAFIVYPAGWLILAIWAALWVATVFCAYRYGKDEGASQEHWDAFDRKHGLGKYAKEGE